MKKFITYKALFLSITIFFVLFFVYFFDPELAIGLLVLCALLLLTIALLYRHTIFNKALLFLIVIVFIVHLSATLFISYRHFDPFGGGTGDYTTYDQEARIIAQHFKAGDFLLRGTSYHSYSLLVGWIYYLTLPSVVIGQLFNLWLVVLSVVFVFLIVKELGGSETQSFISGFLAVLYPSLLFYGSFLLKDALVVCACLIGLWLTMRLIKCFSWQKFLLFYILLGIIVDLRFYIGFALLITFVLCWFLLSQLPLKRKIISMVIIIPLLGFLFEIPGYGYYGARAFQEYFSQKQITYYREVVYSGNVNMPKNVAQPPSSGSTVAVKTNFNKPLLFLANYVTSFIFVVFGPFPWQLKHFRQFVALFETIPWYMLSFFIVKGIIKNVRQNAFIVVLILFSAIVYAVLSLYVPNFGIVVRVRMPAVLALLCLFPLGLHVNVKNLKEMYYYFKETL